MVKGRKRVMAAKTQRAQNRKVTFMSNIGLENERITTDTDVLDKKIPYFTIAIIR